MATRREFGYAIVEADNVQELCARVQTFLAQGFVPAGGISCMGTVGLVGAQGPKFYQTMIMIREVQVSDEEAARHGMRAVEPPSA